MAQLINVINSGYTNKHIKAINLVVELKTISQ